MAAFLSGASAQAAGARIPHGTLELLSENQSISPGSEFYLGLHFQLEKGWHIYWRNPGDSGDPPRLTWQLPTGLTAGAIEWPTPERLGTSSIVDFGYQDAVMLLVPMHADARLAGGQPARLAADVKILICREMCIPGKAQLSLILPIQLQPPVPDGRTRDLFAETRKVLPRPAPAKYKFKVGEEKDSFVLTANVGRQIGQATFFPIAPSQIDNAAPQKVSPLIAGFQLRLTKSAQLLRPMERLKGVVVLSAGQAYVIDVLVSRPGGEKSPSSE